MNDNIYQTEEYRGCTINICYDLYPDNPRKLNDGYLSHIICFHPRYNLGDEHSFDDERVFMERLARDHASYKQIEEYLLEHKGDAWLEKTADGYTLHDFSDAYYDVEYCEDAYIEAIIDQCWDYLSDRDLFNLAKESGELIISTISYYDHSGLTVWIGSPNNCWDSGWCGWIYQTKKDTIEQNGGTEENWREVAWKNMEAEMDEYDNFIRGECFGWMAFDESDNHIGSCWGFVGSECINEMIAEAKDVVDSHIQQVEEKRNSLIEYMTANFEKIPEGQVFWNGDTAYRTDRCNLFGYLQLTSAPIKNRIIGLFKPTDFSSVPTVILECMKSTIENPQIINAI